MQETLNSKKQGDAAFRTKDFTTAIDCYTQVSLLYETPFSFHNGLIWYYHYLLVYLCFSQHLNCENFLRLSGHDDLECLTW